MTDGETPDPTSGPASGLRRSSFGLGRRKLKLRPSEEEAGGGRPGKRKPPSRRSPILSVVSGVLSFVLIVALAAAAGLGWARHRLNEPGPLQANKVVVIPPRTDVPDAVAGLERQGVINDSTLFDVALVLEGKRSKVQAGEYEFEKGDPMQAVMDEIVSGRQVLHSITIPEGLTSEQIVDRLMADDGLSGSVDHTPPEGSLFPETYKFVRGVSRERILHEMSREAQQELQNVWANRAPDNLLKSPEQMLTLASMVEKETGIPSERPLIAGVFLNRLKKGMRLQSDPTVVYGLVGGKGTLGRSITHVELLQPTPYNTYLINGLPPGPITNPGRASLEAAAHPTQTDDLYFVADGSGGHVFAATLAQHNKNVERWRELEKVREAEQPVVDHVAPQDLPGAAGSDPDLSAKPSGRRLKRSNQRGDAAPPSIYGELPNSMPATGASSFAPGGTFARLASAAPGLNAAEDLSSRDADPKGKGARGADSDIALGPTVESLGLTLGLPPGMQPNVKLDGPADDPTTDPENPQNAAMASTQPPTQAPTSQPAATTPYLTPINGHPRIVDASVGTPLDPLKNTTWDLNSPKTVPQQLSSN